MTPLERHAPPLDLEPGWAEDIVTRYSGPGRHYHTVQHLEEMLDAWAEVRWDDPAAAWVAVLLHDAVYVVGAQDNEARSAMLVDGWVERFVRGDVDRDRVRRLILETARHGQHHGLDHDTARFVDCDMAILASSPSRFDEYEEQVRKEWIPLVGRAAYEAGRRAFFEGLQGGRIFQSEAFAHLEAQAQANLARR